MKLINNKIALIVIILLLPFSILSQNKTYIPDDNFENYLESNGMGDGILLNDSVFTSNINTVTNLTISFLSISDLTGIQDFDALSILHAEGNSNLTSINLSQNYALVDARFNSCDLNTLDLSNNPQLSILTCGGNNLSSLDVSNNTMLTILDCWNNSISNLDLSQNTFLTSINCNSNQISNLDFSNNPNMINISCNSNLLSSLDLLHLSNLQILWCPGNNLTELDLSQNGQLNTIRCENNNLLRLDVQNGNNLNISQFFSTGNPNLTCINVDDSTYSTNNWTNIDPQQFFGEACYCNLNIDNQINVSCYGGYDGSLTLSGSGGTDEFFYSIQYFNSFFNMYFELAHSPDTGQYISYPATFMNIPANCYLITLEDSLGCVDSMNVCITQPDSIYSITDSTVCDYIIWNMTAHAVSGTYNSVLTAANGCDSSAILNLTVNYSDTNYTNITACDSIFWDGTTYFTSGTYTNVYTNSNGCDSLEILNLVINNGNSTNFSVSSCNPYIWDGISYNSSGIYSNTYSNINGCDSIVTLNLTINGSSTDSVFVNACEEYLWDGILYDSTGLYTFIYTNVNGCDSIIILGLNIYHSDTSVTNVSACGNYTWNGTNYTQSGTYIHVGTPNFNTYSLSFDGNNDYVEAPSISVYDTIKHNLTLSAWIKLDNSFSSNGSIIARRDFVGNPNGERHHFEITVLSDKSIAFSTANNQNNSLYTAQLQTGSNVLSLNTWHYVSCTFQNGNVLIYVDGQIVASQNFGYREMYPNSHWLNFGIVHRSGGSQFFNEFEGLITNVEIWAKVLSQSQIQDNMICSPLAHEQGLVGYWNFEEGSGAVVNDLTSNLNHANLYNGTSFFQDAPIQTCGLINQNGCDSVAVLNLTITNVDTFYTSITACNNFDWNGITYDSSGIYSNIYTNSSGCDSLVILDLTINNASYSTITVTSCDSFIWDGVSYDSSGVYSNLYSDVNGCDSLVTLYLSINYSSSSIVIVSSCGGYIWDGVTYNTTGVYSNLYSDVNGCDSLVTLDLTINNGSSSTVTVNSCDSFIWDGVSYDSTGVYSNLYSDVNGCDSLVTLDLTINNGSSSTLIVSACGGYIWDGVTYNTTGVYSNLYSDVNGCDSLVTLDLTINNGSSSTVTVTACGGYIWDGVTYNTTGVYTNLYSDVNGCDSLVSLNLTITEFPDILQNDTTICYDDSIVLSYNQTSFLSCTLPSNLQTSLTGFYPFCGNADDESTFSNNGNVIGANLTNDRFGNSNSAYSFDGNNDYIDLGNPSPNPGSLTISAWVKTTEVINAQRWIVSRSNWTTGAWQLMTYDGYAATEFDWGGQLVGNTFIADGQWHHILTIYDATTDYRYLYVDGILDGIDMSRGPFNENGNQLLIGKRSGSSGTFNGDIDDVILYNRVLSLSEIQELYSNTSQVNNYLWSTGDSSSSIVVYPNQTTTYWLENNNYGYSCRDSITITVNDTSLTNLFITDCDAFLWDGITYTTTGTYTNIYSNVNGCDSTVVLDLTINNSYNYSLVASSCDSYFWDGITYDSSGLYTNIYTTTSGCDSIVTLDLTINSSYLYSDTVTTCDSYVFSFYNGLIYDSSGVYTDTLISNSGCDSIFNLVLTVNYSDIQIDTISSCYDYVWYGQTLYLSGTYDTLFTNSNGCDSLVSLNLTIENNTSSLDTVEACDSYLWNGNTYFSSGYYDSLFTNSAGCDSLAILFLTINNSDSSFTNVSACDSFIWNGNTYDASGIYYDYYASSNSNSVNLNGQGDYIQIPDASINNLNSGTYMAWIKLNDNTSESILCKQSDGENTYSSLSVGYYVNQSGHGNPADAGRLYFHSQNSVPHASSVDLISNNIYTHVAVTFSQDSATFYIDGQFSGTTIGNYSIPNDLTVTYTRLGYYNVQGTYFMDGNIDEFSVWNRMLTQQEIQQFINCSPNGVESNLVAYWNMNQGFGQNVEDISTNNFDGILSGATWDIDVPIQNCQLSNNSGCDSVAVLDLTINNSITTNLSITSCDSYTWDGVTYDSSGIYSNAYTANNGCDSLVILDLIINSSFFGIISQISCDSYTWDGVTYDSTGSYTNVYSNTNGCDSIVTLDLIINNSNSYYISDSVCGFYVWDGVTYDSTGIFTNIYSDVNGCDSSVTLDLTIFNGSSTNLSITSCNTYIWDGVIYDTSGIYSNLYVNSNGCDSTVILDLTINYSNLSSFNVNVCDSFVWDGVVYDSTGIYTNVYTNINGCDSVVTLQLSLNIHTSILDTHEICLGDSVYVGNSIYYLQGNYIDTLYYLDGCDSLIINSFVSILPSGCTDPIALNFDSLAQCDDNSCIMPIYGCLDSNAINFYSGANIDDGSCIYVGCTDPNANNYNPLATIDDGSCVFNLCSNPSPFGLFSDNITDKQATINWINMNSFDCMVWKYYVRYREVGTNTWTTKSAGVGSGLCNIGLNTTSKILKNLNPSTTYEFKMKAFYCGGTESTYSSPVQFTTKGTCPEMINLSTQTFYFNPNKVRFNWDTTGQYVFARILLRVDSAGSSWQTAGGFGIYYPNLTVNKFGLQAGEFYRAQGRTFCDSNITSYRSWWTPPIFWQQPSQIRLDGGTSISHLDVFPNPSKDVFNISFNSEIKQTLRLRILNVVGEEIYVEEIQEYIGEYTKQINLDSYRKGIYLLEIETDNGFINKKIIIQ